MKKSILLFCSMLFTGATLLAQSSLTLIPAPQNVPTFDYSSPDNFQATKIVEAKKGNDGLWYCLVKLEALTIKNNWSNINYRDQPSFINSVYFLSGATINLDHRSNEYFLSQHNFRGYSPNIPGQNEVSLYKSYNQYMPTGEKGFFVWLKANYGTDNQIGIIPNPGANSLPLPHHGGGDLFNLMYTIGYSYKSGFPSNIFFGTWIVKMERFPLGIAGGRNGIPLSIDLVISRPNN